VSVLDFAKKHPVMVGGGVLVAIIAVVLVMSSGGGDGTASVVSQQGDASAGAALQAAQLQAQAQAYATDAALAAKESDNYTAVAIAEIQAAISGKSIEAQYQLGAMQIQSDQATTLQGQTLSAQVSNAQIAAQTQQTEMMYNTINNQTNALVKQAQINKKQPGLFSWLFG